MTEEKVRRDVEPAGVLRLLGEGGIRLTTQLISNIHINQTGEWPKDFTGFRVTALKKKRKLQNPATMTHDQPHRTYGQDRSNDTYKKDKIKIEDVLGNLIGFRRGEGNRSAIWMLKIISDRNLDIDLEFYVCFID